MNIVQRGIYMGYDMTYGENKDIQNMPDIIYQARVFLLEKIELELEKRVGHLILMIL